MSADDHGLGFGLGKLGQSQLGVIDAAGQIGRVHARDSPLDGVDVLVGKDTTVTHSLPGCPGCVIEACAAPVRCSGVAGRFLRRGEEIQPQ